MSLINEALKRAKQAQKENPVPPPALEFKAADPSQRRSSGSPILLVAAIVVVLALVGLFVAIALQTREAVQPVANANQPNAGTVQTATAMVTPAVNPVPAPAIVPPAASVAPASTINAATVSENLALSTNPAVTNSEMSVTNAAIDAPPKPALPKLQGISYRPAQPSAVINGKNVYVGNRVGDFQVLSITQEDVTIGSTTQTNVLRLE